jgi:hypothetical protein
MVKINIEENKSDLHIIVFSGFSDQNYLNDALVCVCSFLDYGISPNNIHCFVPVSTSRFILDFNSHVNVYDFRNYAVEAPKINAKYIINIVTGHGSPKGIQFDNSQNAVGEIRPFEYVKAIQAIHNLELCIFIFGQCYAGIFNFWDSNQGDKKFVFIGATGTHSSLNSEVINNFWMNVYLFYITTWFTLNKNTRDVNGDGYCDLLDCFKFAGAETSQLILKNRSKWYREIRSVEGSLNNPHLEPLDRNNAISKMNSLMDALYSIQEPWILNANLARNIFF